MYMQLLFKLSLMYSMHHINEFYELIPCSTIILVLYVNISTSCMYKYSHDKQIILPINLFCESQITHMQDTNRPAANF